MHSLECIIKNKLTDFAPIVKAPPSLQPRNPVTLKRSDRVHRVFLAKDGPGSFDQPDVNHITFVYLNQQDPSHLSQKCPRGDIIIINPW